MKVVVIAYLVSSCRPDFDDKDNLVLTAVITNEADWQIVDIAIKRIKLNHLPSLPDIEIEIHAEDLLNPHGLFREQGQ